MSNSTTKYSAAPTKDVLSPGSEAEETSSKLADVEVVEANPDEDKAPETLLQKIAFYLCWVGFAFIFAGLICAFIMAPIVRGKILRSLPLQPDTEVFNKWKNPPVTPLLFVRLFNLTNEEEFMSGQELPRLEEVGPYTYRQKMQRTRVIFKDDYLNMEYEVRRRYDFAPDLSDGSEDDFIIVPNVPLFGAMKAMSSETTFAKEVFEEVLSSYDFGRDTGPFIKLTVKEFLWGYKSILISLNKMSNNFDCNDKKNANPDEPVWDSLEDWGFEETTPKLEGREKAKPDCDLSPKSLESFGIFHGRNGTSLDNREVGTGKDVLADKGMMKAWAGQEKLAYWNDDVSCHSQCNIIKDSRDPSILPIHIDKRDSHDLFIGQICRKLRFKYVQEVYHDSFKTFRYAPAEDSFDNPTDVPDNGCYCLTEPCMASGILDFSSCSPGSPVVISWPHFLYADPDLRKKVVGMKPDPQLHRFYMDIHPTYGITLSALARLQMNVQVERGNGFSYFENIGVEELTYPFMWIEEGIIGPSEEISESLTKLLTLPDRTKVMMALGGVLIGFVLLIPEIIYWIRGCICQQPAKEKEALVEEEL